MPENLPMENVVRILFWIILFIFLGIGVYLIYKGLTNV